MNARWQDQPEAWEERVEAVARETLTMNVYCFGCDSYYAFAELRHFCKQHGVPGYLCGCHALWFDADGSPLQVLPASDRLDCCMVLKWQSDGSVIEEKRNRYPGRTGHGEVRRLWPAGTFRLDYLPERFHGKEEMG